MRRRVSLVLSSLLAVLALASGGWLLDPAGSRQPFGLQSQTHPNPTRSGTALYAAVTREMVAKGSTTYTYSGSSGGGETQSGSGVAAVPAVGPGRADLRRGRHGHVADDGTDACGVAARRRLPRAAAGQGAATQQALAEGVGRAPETELGRQLTPVAEQMRAAFDPGQGLGLLRAAGRVEEVGPATVEGVLTTRAPGDDQPAQGQPAGRGRGDPRAVPRDAGGRRADPGVRGVAGRQRAAAPDPGRRPDHPGPVLGDRGLPRLGRPGEDQPHRSRSRSTTRTRSRAEPGERFAAEPVRRRTLAAATDRRSLLPQGGGRRPRSMRAARAGAARPARRLLRSRTATPRRACDGAFVLSGHRRTRRKEGQPLMARPDKAAAVAELTEEFRSSSAAVLTEYRGLTVAQLKDLRRSLGADTSYAVVKNTLTKIAAKEAGVVAFDDMLQGPSAIAFVKGDPVEAAKGLRDFAKANPLLVIKGGVLDGKSLTPAELTKLADLESREVLLAKMAGALQASLTERRLAVRCAAGADRTRHRGAAAEGRAGPQRPAGGRRYAGRRPARGGDRGARRCAGRVRGGHPRGCRRGEHHHRGSRRGDHRGLIGPTATTPDKKEGPPPWRSSTPRSSSSRSRR